MSLLYCITYADVNKWNIFNFLAASGGELTPERLDFSKEPVRSIIDQ